MQDAVVTRVISAVDQRQDIDLIVPGLNSGCIILPQYFGFDEWNLQVSMNVNIFLTGPSAREEEPKRNVQNKSLHQRSYLHIFQKIPPLFLHRIADKFCHILLCMKINVIRIVHHLIAQNIIGGSCLSDLA